jgi:hypothetical protein
MSSLGLLTHGRGNVMYFNIEVRSGSGELIDITYPWVGRCNVDQY